MTDVENQVRELLREMAEEVPAFRDVPPRLATRARRRIALRLGTSALAVIAAVVLTIAGLRSLPLASRFEPGISVTPSPPSVVTPTTSATLTLSDGACSYDGPDVVPQGLVTIDAVNGTGKRMYAALLLIDEAHTFDDLKAWIAGPQGGEPPTWVTTLVDDEVPHKEKGTELTASVSPGTYAIVCFTPHAERPVVSKLAAAAVGTFTVAG